MTYLKKLAVLTASIVTASFALSGTAKPADAATYYVSKAGSASDSYNATETLNNSAKPYATIGKAVQRAHDYPENAVDTIIVQPGIYTEKIVVNQDSLTIKAAYDANVASTPVANRTVLRPSGPNVWYIIQVNGRFVNIRGLELDGTNAYIDTATYGKGTGGVNIYGAHTDSTTHAAVRAAAYVRIYQCIVHDVGGGGIGSQNDNYLTDPKLEGSLAGGCDYITIEDNTVYNCCNWSKYETSGVGFHGNSNLNTGDTNPHCIIQRNRIYDNICKFTGNDAYGDPKHTDGNGVIIDTCGHQNPPTMIRNNLIYKNGARAVNVFQSSNVTVINNTVYKNNQDPDIVSRGSGSELAAVSAHDVLFANNIVYGVGGSVPAFVDSVGYAYGQAGGQNLRITFRACTYYGCSSGSANIPAGVIDWNTVFNQNPYLHAPDSGDLTVDVAPGGMQYVIDRSSTIAGDFATDDFHAVARPATGKDRGAYERSLTSGSYS